MTRFGEDNDDSGTASMFRKCSGFSGLKWIQTDSNEFALIEIVGDSRQGCCLS